MLKIKDLKTLRKLKYNNKENETALVEENHTLYKWDGKTWNVVGHTGINASLYQINQAIYTSMPAMDDEKIQNSKKIIFDYCEKCCNDTSTDYFTIFNREDFDFTIFHIGYGNDKPLIEDSVIELLQNRGEIKDIALTEEDTVSPQGIECWVTKDKVSKVYYLFNYQEGVIECQ